MTSYFVHPQGICDTNQVGDGTRIWAFTHVLAGAIVGSDCNLCECVFVEDDVQIGNRVTIKNGVQLWNGIRVRDDVFIGPNVTFTNDLKPRSKRQPARYSTTTIEQGASIGANATVLPGITIGMWSMIGAGSVVTRDVPQYALVLGNPARIIGYVNQYGERSDSDTLSFGQQNVEPASLKSLPEGCKLHTLPVHEDMRGRLAVAEFLQMLDFPPIKRLFFVYGVPTSDIRGEHAHRKCHQLLICVSGMISVRVDDGIVGSEVLLDSPNKALHVPPAVWCAQYRFSKGSVLAVLASHEYDPNDYIRSYSEFLDYRKTF